MENELFDMEYEKCNDMEYEKCNDMEYEKCNDLAEFIASLKYETATEDNFNEIREILEEFDFDHDCHPAFSKYMKQTTQELFDELYKKFGETTTQNFLNLFEKFGGRKSKKRGSKKRNFKKVKR